MTKTEVQTILGYVNIGLAVAHNIGVKVGHFGNTDFLQLAEAVNSMLLSAIAPQPVAPTTGSAETVTAQ